jgi:uncharacterized protein
MYTNPYVQSHNGFTVNDLLLTIRIHPRSHAPPTHFAGAPNVLSAAPRPRWTLHPRGAVGVIVRSPGDLDHSYRVRFPDGVEETLRRDEVVMLAQFKEGTIGDVQITAARSNLYPPADLHWSLFGVPEQLECDETQEHYWELQRFLVLALKADPNVLECYEQANALLVKALRAALSEALP